MRFVAVVIASVVAASVASAQSTAFSYQGQLRSNGAPANGVHDFRFRLFDAPSGGSLIGSSQCADNISVNNGLFAATMDFGNQFVAAVPRYLEIQVRSDTGLDCGTGTYTTLLPRQLITPAPRAISASVANALASPDGSAPGAVIVDNSGKVGVGTPTPTHSVHVAAIEPTIALQDLDSTGVAGGSQVGYISFRDSGNVERAWVGYGSAGDPDFSIINARSNGDIVLNTLGGGKVGIGTASPTAALEVRGEVRYGTLGQYRPAACEEPLRMIRGKVRADGVLLLGAGWTATNDSLGEYTITFTTPFTGAPVVTANQDQPSLTGQATGFVAVTNVTTTSAHVRLFTTSALNNQNFYFIAIGPR